MKSTYEMPDEANLGLEHFGRETERFKRGELSAAEYRAFRVPRGVYEQREDGVYMLRIRCPAGVILPDQLSAIAKVSSAFGNGVLHMTTRQGVQVHGVGLDDITSALLELHEAGLSTLGGGGNSVRNVTGCCDAGVCPHEQFDIGPFPPELTSFMLGRPGNLTLPRKYKVAFSGCARDCAGAAVNDLGFIATSDGERPGFDVYIGGGMGAVSRVGELLESNVPADQVPRISEAVMRVFDRYGNRRNKHRARLRFLVEKLGLNKFKELYRAELAACKSDVSGFGRSARPQRLRAVRPPRAPAPAPGFDAWAAAHTRPQKQSDYFVVEIPLFLGDITADTAAALSRVADTFGEGLLKADQWQNLQLRWVAEEQLPQLHADLAALGLAERLSPVLSKMVACAGADTCRPGICLSRGLADAVRKELEGRGLDLQKAKDLGIYISGCPNSCGRHPVADIALFGAARRVTGLPAPAYVAQVGGRAAGPDSALAKGSRSIPSRAVPRLVADLIQDHLDSGDDVTFTERCRTRSDEMLARIGEAANLPEAGALDRSFFVDWGARQPFSLEGRGPGECGAGVFDLIELDLGTADEELAEGKLHAAAVHACRALLVTRGKEASLPEDAPRLFARHFVQAGLISKTLAPVVEQCEHAFDAADPEREFRADGAAVQKLVDAVKTLYRSMDDSLRFEAAHEQLEQTKQPVAVDRQVDFRGVTCPLNFVKTRMALQPLPSGSVLSVLLDDDGGKNVPESVAEEGHEVLSVDREENHWKVTIRRA